jgi:hypothetical protein
MYSVAQNSFKIIYWDKPVCVALASRKSFFPPKNKQIYLNLGTYELCVRINAYTAFSCSNPTESRDSPVDLLFFLYMFLTNQWFIFRNFLLCASHRGEPAAKCYSRWQPTRRLAFTYGLGRRQIRTREWSITVWRATVEPPRLPFALSMSRLKWHSCPFFVHAPSPVSPPGDRSPRWHIFMCNNFCHILYNNIITASYICYFIHKVCFFNIQLKKLKYIDTALLILYVLTNLYNSMYRVCI